MTYSHECGGFYADPYPNATPAMSLEMQEWDREASTKITISLTPDTLRDRLNQWEARRRAQFLEEAERLELEASPDPITGGWAVRSPRRPGYVEIVTEGRCTCQQYAVRRSCPHSAIVAATN